MDECVDVGKSGTWDDSGKKGGKGGEESCSGKEPHEADVSNVEHRGKQEVRNKLCKVDAAVSVVRQGKDGCSSNQDWC